MLVKCPFCAEKVTFADDSICPACNTELSDKQKAALHRAIQKKREEQTAQSGMLCEMCGTANPVDSYECSSCGESLQKQAGGDGHSSEIWRKKKILIFTKEAVLPDVCIKTNQPAKGNRMEKKLAWYPIWTFLVGGVLLALLFQKRATVSFGITKELQDKKSKLRMIGYAITAGGFLLAALMIVLLSSDVLSGMPDGTEETCAILILVGVLTFFAGLIFASIHSRFIVPTKITKTHVYLSGAHPEYINRFPQWEGR